MKVVDSDIFIDFLRGREQALEYFEKNQTEILFSAVTEAELLSGKKCNDQKEKELVLHVLSRFKKIPVDNPLVQIGGDLRRVYGLELPDAIIAASAIMTNSTLVTRNLKDFKMIKELAISSPY